MANSGKLTVLFGPSNIDGGVMRVIELADGSGRIEAWERGKGWVPAAGSLDDFMPGAAKPVSAELAARLGIPASELGGG